MNNPWIHPSISDLNLAISPRIVQDASSRSLQLYFTNCFNLNAVFPTQVLPCEHLFPIKLPFPKAKTHAHFSHYLSYLLPIWFCLWPVSVLLVRFHSRPLLILSDILFSRKKKKNQKNLVHKSYWYACTHFAHHYSFSFLMRLKPLSDW